MQRLNVQVQPLDSKRYLWKLFGTFQIEQEQHMRDLHVISKDFEKKLQLGIQIFHVRIKREPHAPHVCSVHGQWLQDPRPSAKRISWTGKKAQKNYYVANHFSRCQSFHEWFRSPKNETSMGLPSGVFDLVYEHQEKTVILQVNDQNRLHDLSCINAKGLVRFVKISDIYLKSRRTRKKDKRWQNVIYSHLICNICSITKTWSSFLLKNVLDWVSCLPFGVLHRFKWDALPTRWLTAAAALHTQRASMHTAAGRQNPNAVHASHAVFCYSSETRKSGLRKKILKIGSKASFT